MYIRGVVSYMHMLQAAYHFSCSKCCSSFDFASKLPHRVVLTATMPRMKRRAASSSTGSSDDERPKAMPRIRLPEHIQCYNSYHHPLPKPPGYHGVRNMAAGRISVEDRLHDLVRFQHDNDEWNRAMADAGSGDSRLANMTTISRLRILIWLQTKNIVEAAQNGFFLTGLDLSCSPNGRKYTYAQCRQEQIPIRHWNRESRTIVAPLDCLIAANPQVNHGRKVAVLSMANPRVPGGGYKKGKGAQEENLYRRSDAFRYTDMRLYPIEDDECLIHPDVTILRGAEAQGYPWLEQPFPVTVISCAAVHRPELDQHGNYFDPVDRARMIKKADIILGACVSADCDTIIASAFGCGAFGNPPQEVAQIWKDAVSKVPRHRIRQVIFAIKDDHNAGKSHNPRGNFVPFEECFHQSSSS